MQRIKSNHILLPDREMAGYVYFCDGKITAVTDRELPYDRQYDATELYVSPGFIDLHTHGGGGASFDGSAQDVAAAADFHLSCGTTSICPTVSAAPIGVMEQAVKSIATAMEQKLSKANIIGAHLEGPYLSAKQCGAQHPDFITPPIPQDYEKLVENYGDYICRWSYAPENDPEGVFCRFLVSHSILPAAGHTDATYAQMLPAMEAGCRLITHLYSCTSTVTREMGARRLGVIETAFLEDSIYAEIICDGKHLPPELIKMILKIMGTDRVALVTDSLAIAGTDIKSGMMQATPFIVEDGVCKLHDRSAYAGSVATADRLIRVATRQADVPMHLAVKMLTRVPAQLLKLPKGELSEGLDADILIFDRDVNIQKVFIGGHCVIQ